MTAGIKFSALKRHRAYRSYNAIQNDRELRLSKVYAKLTDTDKRLDSHEADISSIKEKLNTLVIDVEIIKSNYATKADLANLKSDLKLEVAELKSDLKLEVAELKTELKVDIATVKRELLNEFATANLTQTRWLVGLMFVAIGLVFSIQRLFPPQINFSTAPTQSSNQPLPPVIQTPFAGSKSKP